MGFFSFLTAKKGPGDTTSLNGELDIKAQPYDTTPVALPPIRGGLPVTGNGPETLEGLRRAARKKSQAQMSVQTQPSSPAPAPGVPRLRSKSVGRPSTAPSVPIGPVPTQRPKSAGRNSNRPPFLVQKTSPGPPYLLGMSGPEEDETEYTSATDAPPVPPIAAQFMRKDAPSIASSRPATAATGTQSQTAGSYAGSVMSGRSGGTGGGLGNGGGYVDLLDAAKPTDFKTRLQAAGARDYGEDVAERNMGVNGVNLNSPAVVAFYALTGGGPLAYKSDGSAVDVHGNKYAAGNIPNDIATTIQGKDRDELSAMANKRIRAPTFPERTTSLLPHSPANGVSAAAGDLAVQRKKTTDDDEDEKMRRRRSVHGGPLSTAASQSKLRPLSMHPIVSNFTFEPADAPAVPMSRPKTSQGLGDSSSYTPAIPAPKKKSQSREERPRSKSTKSAKSIPLMVAAGQKMDSETDDQAPTNRARSASSASRRGRKQKLEDFSQFNFGVPSAGDVPAMPISRYSSRASSTNGSQGQSGPQSQRSYKSRPEDLPPPRPSTSSMTHPRNRSIGASSMRGRPQLADIDEVIPGRRTSWRNESVSSAAPSNATASSNLSSKFSRHTADTSLDLGYTMPTMQKQAAKKSHIRGKSSGTTVSSIRVAGGYQSQRAQAPSPFARALETDGYATSTTEGSDIESFVTKRRPKRHDDEELLFKDTGYGQSGGGLPGLFDSVGADNSVKPTSWSNGRGTNKHTTRARPPTSAPRLSESTNGSSRRAPPLSFPNLEYDDDDTSSSLTASESDADMRSRSGSAATGGDMGSILSGDGRYDAEEEALDEKLDARLVVRLRKEMKRRERHDTRHRTLQTKANKENYEQGHVADTEA